MATAGLVKYRRHLIAEDGMCFFGCLACNDDPLVWAEQARNDVGFAVDPERCMHESDVTLAKAIPLMTDFEDRCGEDCEQAQVIRDRRYFVEGCDLIHASRVYQKAFRILADPHSRQLRLGSSDTLCPLISLILTKLVHWICLIYHCFDPHVFYVQGCRELFYVV